MNNSLGPSAGLEGDSHPNDVKKPKGTYSPLYVVSLFFGSVELGLAYSAGVSSGSIQMAVLAFMGLFAIAIAITFFVFLWKRNWVFYPPSEFSSTSVQAYVNAMRDDGPDISRIATQSVTQAFADGELIDKLNLGWDPEDKRQAAIKEAIDDIRTRALDNVKSSVIRIDPSPLKGGNAPEWEEAYDPQMPVHRFLDRIWIRLQPFAPYPYGTIWLLKDATSGNFFDQIGPSWSKPAQDKVQDDRSLEDVGINGGMTLEVGPAEK